MPQDLYTYIWRTTRREQVVLCALTLVVALLTALPLELQRRIVDHALPEKRLPLLFWLAVAYLGLLVVQGGLKYALNLYRGWLVEKVTRKLRLTIYAATRPREAGETFRHGREPAEAGAVVSMVASEAEDLAGFVGDSFSFPLMQGGTALFVIGYLLWVQPTIALFAILLYLPQTVVVPLGQGAINRWAAKNVRVVRRLGEIVTETPAAEGDPGAQFRAFADESYQARMMVYRIKFLLTAFGNLLDAVGPLIVLVAGGWFVIQGSVALGTIVVFISGIQKVADPWDALAGFYRTMSNARVKYRLIADTLPAKGEQDALNRGGAEKKGDRR
ncbi:MAG TPA: ABC transporter ATP-binding protein [Methylomirabilota bacterium]|nr:ABC transporter ATP-binding protein [Methylomirabilota bacterium]